MDQSAAGIVLIALIVSPGLAYRVARERVRPSRSRGGFADTASLLLVGVLATAVAMSRRCLLGGRSSLMTFRTTGNRHRGEGSGGKTSRMSRMSSALWWTALSFAGPSIRSTGNSRNPPTATWCCAPRSSDVLRCRRMGDAILQPTARQLPSGCRLMTSATSSSMPLRSLQCR